MSTWLDIEILQDVEDVDQDGSTSRRPDAVDGLLAEVD